MPRSYSGLRPKWWEYLVWLTILLLIGLFLVNDCLNRKKAADHFGNFEEDTGESSGPPPAPPY